MERRVELRGGREGSGKRGKSSRRGLHVTQRGLRIMAERVGAERREERMRRMRWRRQILTEEKVARKRK